MKRQGSTSDFMTDRNRELLAAVRRLVATTSGTPLSDLYELATKQPCSRFWVSERRAAEVISRMLRGEPLDDKCLPQRARMYREIFRRVQKWRADNPGHPLTDAVFEAVNSPAPEFYITTMSARVIISRIMRKKFERRSNKDIQL